MSTKKLKFVCISDTHDHFKSLIDLMPKGDVLLFTGDIGEDYLGFGKFIKNLNFKYKIIIPGNHDMLKEVDKYVNYSKNIVVLHQTSCIIQGIHIYGDPYCFCNNTNSYFNYVKMPSKIPPCDVLMTHIPPLHILDLAWDTRSPSNLLFCKKCNRKHKNFTHWGAKSLLKQVKDIRPKFHIFGHVHDDYSGFKKSGIVKQDDVTFINASSTCTSVHTPLTFTMNVPKRKFFQLFCYGRYLNGNGSMIKKKSDVKWKLNENSQLENENGQVLTYVKNKGITVMEKEKAINHIQKWKYFANNFVCTDSNLVIDVDAQNPNKIILWERIKGAKNQNWKLL